MVQFKSSSINLQLFQQLTLQSTIHTKTKDKFPNYWQIGAKSGTSSAIKLPKKSEEPAFAPNQANKH